MTTAADAARPRELLGLRANWTQFWLLVAVNAFVGAMVGLERSVLPLLAEGEFGLASKTAVLSFVATFGMVKAGTNLVAGRLGDLYGRKYVLVAGWLFALPVPFLVIWAPSWSWIVAANVLLGINQGLTWSTTVIMKIDLLGPRRRGLAMGLNEFAGYMAVALSALATGYLAEAYGLRPEPFYLGIAFAAIGTALSVVFVRETRHLVLHEAERLDRGVEPPLAGHQDPTTLFARVSWRDPALSSASQAGLVNNLNDGLAWGLLPLYFAAAGLSIGQIGVIAFVYPLVWSALQLGTGALSDRWGRKWLIAGGMLLQAIALASIVFGSTFGQWVAAAAVLGAGTAMVYPTLLAAVGDVAHPRWRGYAVGIYRFWRDSGYAVGALIAGIVSDWFGMGGAITTVAALTAVSGLAVAIRMPETLPLHARVIRADRIGRKVVPIVLIVVLAACSAEDAPPTPEPDEATAAEGLYGNVPAAVGGTPSLLLLRSLAGTAVAPQPDSTIMDQLGLAFLPSELVVRVGERVVFTNSEAFTHNIHIVTTDTDSTVLHVDTDPSARAAFVFAAEGGYDVTCEEHPGMRAFIFATSAEHAAFAEQDGRFSLVDVPDGTYTLSLWSVDPTLRADTTVVIRGPTEISLRR